MTTKQIFGILSILFSLASFAQRGVTTFGIEYKPVIANRFIGTYDQQFNDGIFESNVKQKLGHKFGMVVRQGLTEKISFETGILITQRNYTLNFAVQDSGYEATSKVGTVSYQLPISALVFTRLGKNLYLNTALGLGINYYPSHVKTTIDIDANEFFLQEGAFRKRMQGSVLANIGFEYRTKRSGYFYFGGSYNLPFSPEYTFAMSYEYKAGKQLAIANIRGSYLTLDFRYFFHEKPNVEQKR